MLNPPITILRWTWFKENYDQLDQLGDNTSFFLLVIAIAIAIAMASNNTRLEFRLFEDYPRLDEKAQDISMYVLVLAQFDHPMSDALSRMFIPCHKFKSTHRAPPVLLYRWMRDVAPILGRFSADYSIMYTNNKPLLNDLTDFYEWVQPTKFGLVWSVVPTMIIFHIHESIEEVQTCRRLAKASTNTNPVPNIPK